MALSAALGVLAPGCSAEDPFDFGGPRSCEVADQNEWVYDLVQHVYLWSDELAVIDPADYDSPSAMMTDLRVDPDRWSRVSDKARSDALFQEGKVISLGIRTRRDADERVVVAEVSPDSPASIAGMQRGDRISTIGGLTTEQIDEENSWSDVYGESEPGVVVDLNVIDQEGNSRPVSLTKDWVTIHTVPVHGVHQVAGRPVGYLQFATFVDTAPEALDEVFAGWNEQGVREVVVDIRYNSGGLISVARHFMHLLVGGIADEKTAYRIVYNDFLAEENLDRALTRLDHSLPAVDHVVFITTGSSLSASELLINAVAAYTPVSLVGGTTGGKPVGSKHFDFCDSVAVPITFRLLNARNEGDYFDGIAPTCPAVDDLEHALGDPAEGSLATALHLLETGECLPLPEAEEARAERAPPLRTRAATTDLEPWPTPIEIR